MAARTFEDSSGAVWEVFEVQRASQKPGAVSAGLEHGWLAFVHGDSKRRLAPFPPEWVDAPASELERLCAEARHAPTPRYPAGTRRPRIRRLGEGEPPPSAAALFMRSEEALAHDEASPPASSGSPPRMPGPHEEAVERAVRAFAQEARLRKLPAIDAMVELKGVLARQFTDPDSPARDRRLVRRWFVETYYFERDA